MLQKIHTSWPTIRQVIYSVAAAIFGGLTLLGVFTDADVTTYLGHTATVLTGIGTLVYILAGLYTPNPKGAQPPTIRDGTDTPVDYRTASVAHPGPGAVVTETLRVATERAQQLAPSVGQLRAELERRISGRG
ncbi:hypothetical protein LZP97_26975 (plasmid) [Rhodococcus sp. DMF-1]|uniref:hypothetical protein n=1 Tax=Rhodococcus TaxID=1827 RepID=UPI000660E3F5|nr:MULTISPECIES: hypothetical protein [Rhodococcus]UIR36980.1 hypothetical protein LZP97_25940 [Rhodococcus sp. DMF-1]UIR37014.1 hypothetical protein LZP97_00100 [Rhodococcus sp. DMF-1]UIR39733.1 hypothetical protein LZP97_26975 [Rhodococcus sp. DMF-1]